MYNNKKNRTSIFIVAAVVMILIACMILVNTFVSRRAGNDAETETETETELVTEKETEAPLYNILLYHNSSGTVEYDSAWLVSDTDEEEDVVLAVEENTLVTMMITPNDGKQLDSVDVLDYDMREISSVLRSASGTEGDNTEEMRLSFVMPDKDIFINCNFSDVEEELLEADYEEETDDGTYGLVLHNVTADVITSFNGMFDEEKFLNALGEALHVDSSRSEYRTVTDVYFGALVENNTEKLSYEIYFNNDMLWKVLATYYMTEDAYVFTEITDETEADDSENDGVTTSTGVSSSNTTGATGTSWGISTVAGVSGEAESTGSSAAAETATSSSETTTSFDILSVSTVFLKFVGSEEEFYQAAFDYILSKGLSGDIVGTMSDYEIDPDNQTATIHIMLSTGASITGTYNKNSSTYSFSGL